tara:strand:+ start:43 stop:279 length:237 start_codon:yes stop_codon:yes gene_type:complete
MIIKKERASWIPPLPAERVVWGTVAELGWIELDGEAWVITNIHHFDDFGCTVDTFTIEKDGEKIEIYSYDEGETFTFD